jgi:hypothetical protein
MISIHNHNIFCLILNWIVELSIKYHIQSQSGGTFLCYFISVRAYLQHHRRKLFVLTSDPKKGFNSMVPATKNLSPESAAYKLRTAWVTGYLNNPAMFHGVMYAASANLDLINGEHDNPVTNFHRAEAIRLVQETISVLESHDNLPIAVLAATWALAHVAVRDTLSFGAFLVLETH